MIDLPEELVKKNRADQQLRLHEYLNHMPVVQLMLDYVEADDIIAYTCKQKKYEDYIKIIVSSDKDFFQLCGDDNVMIWRPVQKEFVDRAMLVHKHGIHPNNYALARAVDGDKSDNIIGVPNVGMKTIKSNFDFLSEEYQYSCDELIVNCVMQIKQKSVHKKLIEYQERIKNNYEIMQLYEPNISHNGRRSIDYIIDNFEHGFNKLEITKMLMKDGQGEINLLDLWASFRNMKP